MFFFFRLLKKWFCKVRDKSHVHLWKTDFILPQFLYDYKLKTLLHACLNSRVLGLMLDMIVHSWNAYPLLLSSVSLPVNRSEDDHMASCWHADMCPALLHHVFWVIPSPACLLTESNWCRLKLLRQGRHALKGICNYLFFLFAEFHPTQSVPP